MGAVDNGGQAPDITVVVNLHSEGFLCQPTLDSVGQAVDAATAAGISVEVLYVLDRASEETVEAVAGYPGTALACDAGELAGARNFAVSKARGRYVSFIDGDDLWGDQWLVLCMREMRAIGHDDVVLHPRNNLYFGRGSEPAFWVHPDMRQDLVDLDAIAVANRWTALCFAPRAILQRHPYRPNVLRQGFGYEDWMWNYETIRAGILHAAVDGTLHFIRRKREGSLLTQTNAAAAMPRFFEVARA